MVSFQFILESYLSRRISSLKVFHAEVVEAARRWLDTGYPSIRVFVPVSRFQIPGWQWSSCVFAAIPSLHKDQSQAYIFTSFHLFILAEIHCLKSRS